MRMFAAASAVALLLAGSAAWAASPSPIDRQFAVKASIGNTFEIKSSEMALARSQDPEVRAMARWMIEDHRGAQRKLDRAASTTGTDAGPILDDQHEAKLVALGQLSGAEFDTTYVADQLDAHRQTAKVLTDFETMGQDPALVRWASDTLPAVDEHLFHFEYLSGSEHQ